MGHLAFDKALSFLTMAGNSLKVGGKIRISTPNLTWVMMTHYKTEKETISDTLTINRAFHGWGHQFLWSRTMLESVLTELGYKDICFFKYGESNDPELNDIERHGGGGGHQGEPSVIIAEATRSQKNIEINKAFLQLVEEQFLQHVRSGH